MILLTAHFGNWYLGAWLTWKGCPLRAVGSPIANPKLDQLITETQNYAGYFNIPIMPAFMLLEPDLIYHLECLPPIPMTHTSDPERDILSDVQECSNLYERVIRQHPEQWAWFHRRWLRRPEWDSARLAHSLDSPLH